MEGARGLGGEQLTRRALPCYYSRQQKRPVRCLFGDTPREPCLSNHER
jgi:hypothetical protein